MHTYPFSAIVGQNKLKQALLLCAINPSIGGLLIRGEKGTAKSTAVRSLSALMPDLERVNGSVFNLSLEEYTNKYGKYSSADTEQIPVPMVNLPLGVSEDRVLGSLDLESILTEKKKVLLPGLLAEAHRGILYIDEVNLLADHLVDVLLDVSASGVNIVQREGLSEAHPARFILIGTMNPEEGNLRPQFLDRFALMVEVEDQMEVQERTEVVRRRIAFEQEPKSFIESYADTQISIKNKIMKARKLLPHVALPEGLLTFISQLCIDWSVSSLRADIVLYKTAIALAAWHGRTLVHADDIRQAAELVLVHRQGKPRKNAKARESSGNQGTGTENNSSDTKSEEDHTPHSIPPSVTEKPLGPEEEAETKNNDEMEVPLKATSGKFQETVFASKDISALPLIPSGAIPKTKPKMIGRRLKMENAPRGMEVSAGSNEIVKSLDISNTVQQSLVRDADDLHIRATDLRFKKRNGKTGHYILFVVDASGSMAALKRMEMVKGTVLSLLEEAYQKRDRVGVISFRGVEAEWILKPTSQYDKALQALVDLPTGGRTPLPHALHLAYDSLSANTSKSESFLVCLSDGKANVALPGSIDAWAQALNAARQIASLNISSLVIDTDHGYLRMGKANQLAQALNAECVSIDAIDESGMQQHIQQLFKHNVC
ncbi:magnesium chelatase subunit D family protein [Dyadobacter tibetensis]|uniref:magnesium chelatase subunit D family protein n=1 Tax=Dyadobacter tibetensis TaxID=1211851 RepID=UPI000471CF3A|nr:magnesium chelatase subunit D family protein [Dyadobacter tibetensis]